MRSLWSSRLIRGVWQAIYRVYSVRGGVEPREAGPRWDRHNPVGVQELVVGNDVYIGKYCTIEVDGQIGDHVLIGNNVGLVGRDDHDSHDVDHFIDEAALDW